MPLLDRGFARSRNCWSRNSSRGLEVPGLGNFPVQELAVQEIRSRNLGSCAAHGAAVPAPAVPGPEGPQPLQRVSTRARGAPRPRAWPDRCWLPPRTTARSLERAGRRCGAKHALLTSPADERGLVTRPALPALCPGPPSSTTHVAAPRPRPRPRQIDVR